MHLKTEVLNCFNVLFNNRSNNTIDYRKILSKQYSNNDDDSFTSITNPTNKYHQLKK